MFSGIVEGISKITHVEARGNLLEIKVEKPDAFNDLHIGDSISIDGVCLTVETFTSDWIQFTLAPETLKVTGWSPEQLVDKEVNVERALAVNSRLHGHWVFGHIDEIAKVKSTEIKDGSLILQITMTDEIKNYIWSKGSVSLNGVSLTINEVTDGFFSVCLIPETLRVTNLSGVKKGSALNLEFDFMARGIVNCFLKGLTPYCHMGEAMNARANLSVKESYEQN